jgi:8-oxo-dGTP pyrophosphatase MutT (NUDIX family)
MFLERAIAAVKDHISPPLKTAEARQTGAIPFALHEGQVFFLLITSRRTGRWIFPKGALMEGLSPWEAAAQEALEEAGVRGTVEREPVGSYRTVKVSGGRRSLVEVDMYPLQVEEQLADWQEHGERHRHWASLTEARRLLDDKALAGLAEIVSRRRADYSSSPTIAVTTP